ncbi:hypothetical protein AG1IA_01138 [Rhizoctonia solani AG-1 IA]|uniref:Uncharacterized protein n=1 Tax=Thanatephorus cucumeris (strain AG1-IA) TaxID=983506 RepID=L8X863_THACA|nr:hypothetical protein AG1IA_01138 [Rhizoctonia solani AG-1 IA]
MYFNSMHLLTLSFPNKFIHIKQVRGDTKIRQLNIPCVLQTNFGPQPHSNFPYLS